MHLPALFLAVILGIFPTSGPAVHVSQSQIDPMKGRFESAEGIDDLALVEVQGGPMPKTVAILRSLVAGLSTTLGAAIVLLLKGSPTPSQMAFALALAAGVMLTVSFGELFGPELLVSGQRLKAALATLGGLLSFMALRKLVPEPDVAHKKDEGGSCRQDADPELGSADDASESKSRQWRLAAIMMLALTAHNFPEGLAVGVSSLQSEHLGLVVMAAIAVHNIPEGIAIAMPVLDATGNRWRAMQMATLSGLAEPLGALVAMIFLPPTALQGAGMTIMLCIVGGIMTSVALIELLPEALAQQQLWSTIAGLVSGCAIMLLTHDLA